MFSMKLMMMFPTAALAAGIFASPAAAQVACDLNGVPGAPIPGTDSILCGTTASAGSPSDYVTAVGVRVGFGGEGVTLIGSHSFASVGPAFPSIGGMGFYSPPATFGSTALGAFSAVAGAGSMAIGDQAKAGDFLLSPGALSVVAFANNATALGSHSLVSKNNGTAIGAASTVSAQDAVAIGVFSSASGQSATTVGFFSSASALGSTVIGTFANSTGIGAFAGGFLTESAGDHGVALGSWSDINTNAIADANEVTSASGVESSAFGAAAQATGNGSIATGARSTAGGTNAAAIGYGASATANGSVALGAGSVADEANTVSVGSAGNERRVSNVAAGVNANDAVNVDQLTAATTGITADITALEAADAGFDTRLDALEAVASGLDDRIDRIDDRASAGTAAAVALSGAMFLPGKTFNLTGNVGSYRGAHAAALQFGALVSDHVALNAGVAHGFNKGGKTALRAGFTIGW
jgi:autotransporter adhesin